ECSVLP
ncbi:hypothetical protein Hypma_005714, partial [Hypsizygus marmoreus]